VMYCVCCVLRNVLCVSFRVSRVWYDVCCMVRGVLCGAWCVVLCVVCCVVRGVLCVCLSVLPVCYV